MTRETVNAVVNLHDAFLNASLQHDRMRRSPVENDDPRVFDSTDRIRFERAWLMFLGVLVEAWNAEAAATARVWLTSVGISTDGLAGLLRTGRRSGAVAALIETRNYMAHRDRREYWDDGRLQYMPHIGFYWELHREFGGVLLLAMRALNAEAGSEEADS